MPLTEDELHRVREQLAREEYERRKAREQNKPSFLRWLGGVGLGFVVTESWQAIRTQFLREDALIRAIKKTVKPGFMIFNPPAEMTQGRKERVEVVITRSDDLHKELGSGLRGIGEPQFERIDVSLRMEVKLSGSAFEITSHSPPEQLLVPSARWQFDVLPCHASRQTITLNVSLRVGSKEIVGGLKGVPVLERQVNIRVNMGFATRRFVINNWQWLIGTALVLSGTLAAWLAIFH
jgi:hypothetical protein